MWLKVALVACKEKIDKAVEEDKACGHIVANILIIRMFGNFSYASYQGVLCFIFYLSCKMSFDYVARKWNRTRTCSFLLFCVLKFCGGKMLHV